MTTDGKRRYYTPAQGALRVAFMDLHEGGLEGFVKECRVERHLSWADIATAVQEECGSAVTVDLLRKMYRDTEWGRGQEQWWKSEPMRARREARKAARRAPVLKQAEMGPDR